MKDGIESLGRVRMKGMALLAVAFVVGGLAGGAVERVRAVKSAPAFGPPAGAMMRPGFGREGELPPMFLRLDLTEEQRARIQEILEESRPRTEALMEEMMPRLKAETDSVRERIREVLTPEQAAKLDSIMENFPGRRGRFMRDGPPRRGR